MTLEAKDLVYLLTYTVTLITILLALRSLLFDIRRDLKLLKSIVYGEKGSLNVITEAVLKSNLDEVWDRIRRTDKISQMILVKIEDMDKNILIMMVHQGITSPNGIRKKIEKDVKEN